MASPLRAEKDQRISPACDIARGVGRLFSAHALAFLGEVVLANGRRVDIVGLSGGGSIWIVEIKSCLLDYRSDHKWRQYRDFCDRLFFAVAPGFPRQALPEDAGLIIADR
ncbi:MAG TPA: MmcB family DNA repair protein, partial [Roseiarcus sp.]|nr:MmcB family DNA repair protein [Roseiarcus sp.]